MVPLIIYSFIEVLEGFPVLFQGEYTDFETAWYNKVMVTIMSTAMVNIVAFPMGAAMPNIIAMVAAPCSAAARTRRRSSTRFTPPRSFPWPNATAR